MFEFFLPKYPKSFRLETFEKSAIRNVRKIFDSICTKKIRPEIFEKKSAQNVRKVFDQKYLKINRPKMFEKISNP